jgi:hypothetical protein
MNGSLPRNYGWFSQAARFRHFASRMRSILEQFEPFAANRVFEIYTTGDVAAWVRQIRGLQSEFTPETMSNPDGHIAQHQS